jgi:3-keto-disaccharide hydrolase/zinc ribbon protein
MNCSVCGTSLPQGVAYCPNCGTPTSSSGGAASDAATVASSSVSATPPPPPTNYGPQPYGNPYNTPPAPYDPYNVAPPPLPSTAPQRPQRRSNRMGLLIGAILLVLVLILGGIVALLLRSGTQVALSPTQATATVTSAQTAIAQATTQANATATAQINAQSTATATAFQNIYTQATSGTPVLSDPLSAQDNNNWDEGSKCVFTGGAYHVRESIQGNFHNCNAQSPNFGNFAYQVQMVITSGDYGGLLFRSDSAGNNGYYFKVYEDGSYFLDVFKNNNFLKTLSGASSTALKTGVGQTNSIAVVAKGSTFYLFINGQLVVSVNDTNFASGEVGLIAGDQNHTADVAYSKLKVWQA